MPEIRIDLGLGLTYLKSRAKENKHHLLRKNSHSTHYTRQLSITTSAPAPPANPLAKLKLVRILRLCSFHSYWPILRRVGWGGGVVLREYLCQNRQVNCGMMWIAELFMSNLDVWLNRSCLECGSFENIMRRACVYLENHFVFFFSIGHLLLTLRGWTLVPCKGVSTEPEMSSCSTVTSVTLAHWTGGSILRTQTVQSEPDVPKTDSIIPYHQHVILASA